MMSIPRDLWVTVASTGKEGRINGAYNDGPANLVQTVKDNLDIPINHYMEVGFGSFAGLVDAIGGVTINFPNPAFDEQSGLVVEQAGDVTLDGTQALAYARSRHYTEIIAGEQVLEPTADLGRQQRQQVFLRTALAEVGATRNPFTLMRVADAMSSELIIDSGLGFGEAISFVRKLGSSDPATVILPIEGVRKGDAAVRELVEHAGALHNMFARPVDEASTPQAVREVANIDDLFASFAYAPSGPATACAVPLPADLSDPNLQRKIERNYDRLVLRCAPVPEDGSGVVLDVPPWPRLD